MGNSTPLPSDDARMVSWREYTATDEYRNTKQWAVEPPHTEGSLWAAFLAGWSGATSRTRNEPAITALAEACERAAYRMDDCLFCATDETHGCECCKGDKIDAGRLRTFAAALRAGRVTVNEGGDA